MAVSTERTVGQSPCSRESLDAPEDLPKQALRQVAPGQWLPASLAPGELEPEVPGIASSCERYVPGNAELTVFDVPR